MSLIFRRRWPLFVGVALFLGVEVAHAEPPLSPTNPAALAHLSQGNKLYNVRSFEEAVAEYKAGAMIQLAPVFDYNLGQCYRQLGKYRDAIWHYERFLKSGAGSPQQISATKKFIAQMKAELEQKAKTEPPTEPARASAQLPPRRADEPDDGDEVDDGAPEAWYGDTIGWGLGGAGLVAGVVSGVLLIQAGDLHADADAAPTAGQARALHDKADRRSLAGAIVGIGAAGLLVAGGVKLALHSDGTSTAQTAWGIGASWQGAFVWGQF